MKYMINLLKCKIDVFEEVYILFSFNIIIKHKGMSTIFLKMRRLVPTVHYYVMRYADFT